MAKTKYQLEDFLAAVNDGYKNYVTTIHEMLLQRGYKLKVQTTKSYGLHVSYSDPKIKVVKGIIAYLLIRDEKLTIRINADNLAEYPDVLNRLPQNMVSQLDNANECIKMKDPQKCWQGCIGYDFYIGEKHYQKCVVNCFVLDVNSESFPFLLELIERESKERS